jgi:hypothetical protein
MWCPKWNSHWTWTLREGAWNERCMPSYMRKCAFSFNPFTGVCKELFRMPSSSPFLLFPND